MQNKSYLQFKFWLRKSSRFIFSRFFLVSLLLFLQALIFFLLFNYFFTYSLTFYTIGSIFSILTVIYLISTTDNPAYKLMWAIFILAISPIGSVIYWLIGWQKIPPKKLKQISYLIKKSEKYLPENQESLQALGKESQLAAHQAAYLQNWAHCPLFQNTKTQYFSFGEQFFAKFKIELQKAQHFIFLEYFIIEENSQIWNEILAILQEKVSQGVEVRLIYDDLASVLTVSGNFARKMGELGIKTLAFNRFRPFLEIKINHRDHRKIAIIDNQVAFTGGINLGDRYINLIKPHGLWKDSAVLLQGEAVWSFTLMFLQIWNFIAVEKLDFEFYHLPVISFKEKLGFIQPFADIPYDQETIAHNIYLNLINKAQRKIIITTPYLIIDHELTTALSLAAKSGVKVKIITPKNFDHWYTKIISQAFYIPLLEQNVEIWQYEPGFIHSKSFLVDNEIGVISTINLDYRSFYLNFEDGVWMYQTQALKELSQDLNVTLNVCRQVKLNEIKGVHLPVKLLRGLLRLIATLM